jgi:hypothetical protein
MIRTTPPLIGQIIGQSAAKLLKVHFVIYDTIYLTALVIPISPGLDLALSLALP